MNNSYQIQIQIQVCDKKYNRDICINIKPNNIDIILIKLNISNNINNNHISISMSKSKSMNIIHNMRNMNRLKIQ